MHLWDDLEMKNRWAFLAGAAVVAIATVVGFATMIATGHLGLSQPLIVASGMLLALLSLYPLARRWSQHDIKWRHWLVTVVAVTVISLSLHFLILAVTSPGH